MTLAEKDIHLHYTEELTKKSVLYYCWSVTGNLFVAAMAFLVLSLIFLIQYDGSSMVITLISFTLVWVPAVIGVIYYISLKRAMQKFRNLPEDGKAIFGITHDHFSLKVGNASSDFPWTAISKIQQFEDFWLIMLRPRGFFTLPTHNLLQEDKDFILGKMVRRRKGDRGLFPKERRV